MDIYELLDIYRSNISVTRRIVGAIMNELNDRRGIKQELQACDEAVIEEIFETLTQIVAEQMGDDV